MSEGLLLPTAVAEQLLDHARAELPNEACGLLAGDVAAGIATTYHPARNAEASPFVYNVHPDDLVRIVMGIEDAGEELVAIFHAHPSTPAVPSPTDRREARYPGVTHLLATLVDPHAAPAECLRGWRIEDGKSREVELRLVTDPDQQSSISDASSEPSRASMTRSMRHDPSSPPDR
jgi:proteasome lid subunit RPN8/RPN11